MKGRKIFEVTIILISIKGIDGERKTYNFIQKLLNF